MNGDTGEAELAVASDLTVSIGFYKKGLFAGRAPELIGSLTNVDIGIVLEELSGETE
jgi:NAD(P)H-hydrate epimerase